MQSLDLLWDFKHSNTQSFPLLSVHIDPGADLASYPMGNKFFFWGGGGGVGGIKRGLGGGLKKAPFMFFGGRF